MFKLFIAFVALLEAIYAGALYTQAEEMKKHFTHHKEEGNKLNSNGEPIVIHVIPHSHDDAGWLSTKDQYYYGTLAQGDRAAVQLTISTMVESLKFNPERRFVQVEMAFFAPWWFEQSDKTKEEVRELVRNGQLEFINGGWSQNDEAATYYENIIENMWIGHRFLKNEVGITPTIGWSIDPFGHSATQAGLYSQMGFNGWWFARVDYQDKEKRLDEKGMEMIWIPQKASKKQYPIFTSVNYYHYSAPPGFCFDSFCSNIDPIIDNPQVKGYNVEERSQELVDYFKSMSTHYRTNHLLHTFGEDFQYTNSEQYYKNLDRLIKYINANPDKFENTKIKYSTPSEYLQEINKLDVQFPKQTYDFFPYADNEDAYWTGYFTSRVAGKGAIREISKLFYSQRTYLALLKYYKQSDFCVKQEQLIESTLTTMEQTLGELQHHDSITGTEKQAVAYSYMWSLHNATLAINSVMSDIINEQTQNILNLKLDTKQEIYNWNSTAIECTTIFENLQAGKSVLMTVQNPGVTKEHIIKVKVPHANFDVIDLTQNQTIDCEVVCFEDTDCEAFFKYNLLGHNLNFFQLHFNKSPSQTTNLKGQEVTSDQGQQFNVSDQKKFTIFSNSEYLEYTYCDEKGANCQTQKITINYNKYFSYQSNGQKSGAYIFRPSQDTLDGSVKYTTFSKKSVFNGKIVTLVQMDGDNVNSHLLFQNLNGKYDRVIEITSFVKSIDISDHKGKEIVLEIDSDFKNKDIFYTDTNGLELLERKLNYRPTWNLTVTQPASGNYYPINAMIQIKDSSRTLSLLNDRAQGGSALKEGQVELMIHRRCLYDDGRGVGEALNETNTYNNEGLEQRLRHWIVFGDVDGTYSQLPREIQQDNDQAVLKYFTPLETVPSGLTQNFPKMPLVDNLPSMMKLYLRYYGSNSNAYLMRLHNMNEGQQYTFKQTFNSFDELTLTANQLLSQWEEDQLTWKLENSNEEQESEVQIKKRNLKKLDQLEKKHPSLLKKHNKKTESSQNVSDPVITQLFVAPLEIRTFNITPPAI